MEKSDASRQVDRRQDIAFLVALLVIQAAVILYRTREVYWFGDDFKNFGVWRVEGWTWHYLLTHIHGQVVPGFRALHAAYFELFGLWHAPAAALVLALSCASTVLLVVLAVRLGAERWAIAAGGIVYAFLLQHAHTQLWWAASVHTLPSLVASLGLAVLLAGPDGRGGKGLAQAIGAVLFAVALSFTAKAFFAPMMVAGAILFVQRRYGATWRVAAGKAARTMLWLVPVAATYLVAARLMFAPAKVTTTAWWVLRFVWLAVADGTFAATIGLGPHGPELGSAGAVFALVALAAGIVATIAAGRSVWILWASFGIYLVVSMATIGHERVAEYGIWCGRWGRYNVENATFLVLVAMVASSGLQLSMRMRQAAVVAALLVAANLQGQSHRVSYNYPYAAIREYVEQVRVGALPGNAQPVPAWVVGAWAAPYNRTDYLAALLRH